MPVRVIEADHALSPPMLLDGVYIVHLEPLEPVSKLVKIIFFKVELEAVAAEGDGPVSDKFLIGLRGLEGQTAC